MNGDEAQAGEIIVDSGAADNVMPQDALEKVEMGAKHEGVRFMGADGQEMEYHGTKEINFVPYEFWQAEFGYPFRGLA